MSKLLKHFKNDKETFDVLSDPEKLNEVLFILQEATDSYMEETRKKLADPRRSVQQKAQDALDIATAVIEAEKKIRELQIYNVIALKERGMTIITDA